MTGHLEYKPLDESDVERVNQILNQCFVSSPEEEDQYIKQIGLENFRTIRQGQQILGGLATIAMGQWFGGNRVPMTGIGGVGIAPEYRGSGAAIALMQQMLKELHEREIALSVLYPAVQRLYRRADYEQAGTHCGWEIAANQIQIREQPLPTQAIAPTDEVLKQLYQQKAPRNNGNLDRHPFLWQRVHKPSKNEFLYAYTVGDAANPEGYLVFTQARAEKGTTLKIRDWVAISSAAAQSIWAFLAGHRSQIDWVHWNGGAIDAMTFLLPEQTAKLDWVMRWMLRIVDVAQALSLRGYPPHLELELHLSVQDELLPRNHQSCILSVAQGKGHVTPGGRGDLKLPISTLATLYSGWLSPQQLHWAGRLEGTDEALAIATQLFAGTSPWMPDFF